MPRCRLFEARGIPQYAAGGFQVVGAGNPALADLVSLFAEGKQVPLKDLPHPARDPWLSRPGRSRVRQGMVWRSQGPLSEAVDHEALLVSPACGLPNQHAPRGPPPWAAFLTCPWEVCRSSIIRLYFPRALLGGLAASKVGGASFCLLQRVDLLVGVEELRDPFANPEAP